MKRFLTAVAVLGVVVVSATQPSAQLFSAPYVVSEHQELPRTEFMSYRKAAEAQRDIRDSSTHLVNLNGEWSLRSFTSEGQVPRELAVGGSDLEELVADWEKVRLPGAWPVKNSDQPVEVYVRKFSLPFELFDKAHFLHIGALQGQVAVYVNGHRVGFSQTDSKSPVEFDVTKYMDVEGRNWVSLVVNKSTPAGVVEQWQGEARQFSGVNRDIYLFSQPKIRMRDYLVSTTLEPTYTHGLLETAMLLKTQLLNPDTVTVYYDLYDPAGKLVNSDFREVVVGMKAEDTVRFVASVSKVIKWSAETPELYTIRYRIKREGRFTEYVNCVAGFRTVEVKNNRLLVNGVPMVIKGVNLGEGQSAYMDTAALRSKLMELKHLGVNAIRTAGYPLPTHFYALCDRMGFYVCDVADINVNERGLMRGGSPSNDPAWCGVYLARINAMYERNKNHPSVVMWALGNRSGNGYNMYQGYRMLKQKEWNRPVVYDGAAMEWNTDIYMPAVRPENLAEAVQRAARPVVLATDKYDPAYWSTVGVQGAFVDETTLPQRAEIFADVVVEAVDPTKGIYRFENRLQSTDLLSAGLHFRITSADGRKIVKEGRVAFACPAGGAATVTLPEAAFDPKTGRKITFEAEHISVGYAAD